MRILLALLCFCASYLVASSDCDWIGYDNGLIFRHAITVSPHTLTQRDLQNLCFLNKDTYSILQQFFRKNRLEKTDSFNKAFHLPPRKVWAVDVDNKIKHHSVFNDGKVASKASYGICLNSVSTPCTVCIVPHSFLCDAFGSFMYALEVAKDYDKKLSLSRVKFPILPSGSIVYTDKQPVKDELFTEYTQSFNMHDGNIIVCMADKNQKHLITLFFDTNLEDTTKKTVHLFIMEPLKASYHYIHDVTHYSQFKYPSQENLFDSKGILVYIFNSFKKAYFYSYYFDKDKKSIHHKERFFILEKPENTDISMKKSLGHLTDGLITQVLTWPTVDHHDTNKGDTIIHFYDEYSSSIPKELIEIYLNDLCNTPLQRDEIVEKNDLLTNVRMVQATILLGALNYPKEVNFAYDYLLHFLKKMSVMSHSENATLYRDFTGEPYYKEQETDMEWDMRALENNACRPLCCDAKSIIHEWVLALDPHNQAKNKIKWLADHTKEAMAMQPDSFLALCRHVALRYAKKSWDNGKVAVLWCKDYFRDNNCIVTLYELDSMLSSPTYYDIRSIDENDSIMNVVYKSRYDVEFYFKQSGKYRCVNKQHILVHCDD